MSHTPDAATRARGADALKRIALVVSLAFAGLALLSMAASSAMAGGQVGFHIVGEESEEESEQPRFEAEAFSEVTLESEKKTLFEYGFNAGTVQCEGGYSGEAASESTAVTLTPLYIPFCLTESEGARIQSGGCQHELSLLNEGPPYVGQFAMVCPSESAYIFETDFCTVTIPPQTGLAEMNYSNTGEGSSQAVEATFNVSGLEYIQEGFPFLCEGTHEDGTLTGSTTLEAFE